MLVRLFYASRAAAPLSHEQMMAIFRASKSGNTTLGITGVLCHTEGMFLQALEGGRSAVSKLYNHIAADKRHTDVVLLSFEEITERRFAGWAMGQVNLSRLNPSLVMKYSETARLDPYSLNGRTALALFDDLVATASVVCNA